MSQEEVSILAINYMDRVLNKLQISKNNLQLLAATCTFLASKLREPSTHALQPEVLIYYTDNSITKRDLMVSDRFVFFIYHLNGKQNEWNAANQKGKQSGDEELSRCFLRKFTFSSLIIL